MTDPAFSSIAAISQDQLKNLQDMGFSNMTPVQQQTLPAAMAGNDILAQAKTGSGKTAAFGIPLLQKLNPRFFGVQGMVLCPTRELATQVATELRKLARFQANIKIVVLSGGVSIGPQIGSLEHGAHVIVGTPGRIKDHLRKKTLDISQLQTLVLDEADRMLDMGFSDDIHHIAGHTPENRQTLLFSATYPDNIGQLSRALQNNPQEIRVEAVHSANSIQQQWIMCSRSDKPEAMLRAIHHFDIHQGVVFCNTKQSVNEVAQILKEAGYIARGLHGDLEQRDRDQVYIQFRQGASNFLVATDVAARGLDVDDLPAVINYDLPRDPEVYVHRIGRTGRAGKDGLAISLTTEKEQYKQDAITDQQHMKADIMDQSELSFVAEDVSRPQFVSLCIAGGRKNKLRPGDILGALTSNGGIPGSDVGKIDVLDFVAYVAVKRPVAREALAHLQKSKIKGKAIKVRRV
ncbi:MAG: ATP-dependent RNA helicase DbpA [Oceanospirillaceae bacterium]|nr:ATP-dependent RNA helicase DbpA [Oceanospirillaceae bacterium]